jgi:NitT/TauT family transport system substrate-binding protein
MAVAVAALFASCQIGGDRPTGLPAHGSIPLTVGLGFTPSVQFAPFYLADWQGWYLADDLEVTFQNQIDPNLITLVGQGAVDIGSGDGTSVIPAVSQGIPVVYIATIYRQFPAIVFAKASSGIETAADLEGKRIGIPGLFGSSWIMLQAMLKSAGLTPEDVEIVEYPDFGQGAALAQDQVDAATGFANNEPVAMARSGTAVTVLHVDDALALPGPGLVVSTETLAAKGDAIRAFVKTTLRAMDAVAGSPDTLGLEATFEAVPELARDRDTQLAILQATIDVWRAAGSSANDFGVIDEAGWQASIAYMTEIGVVSKPVTVDQLVDSSYLPSQ